jgi:ubiquinone/menaquinone biosynthesis C-methylase UbiE
MEPKQAQGTWDAVAEAYHKQSERAFQAGSTVSEWLVDAVAAGAGRTILDLAAGPGQTTLVAAARGASVICSDAAPGMVEVARRVVTAAGYTDVDFRVLDAMDMDLDDAVVDGVVCRYGLMLMPEPEQVLGEVRRVLRPGGAFAYGVWRSEDLNAWATLIRRAVAVAGFEPPPLPPGPGMFVLAEPEENQRVGRAAGFESVETAVLDLPMEFDSVDQYWSMRLDASPMTREMLAPLGDDGVAKVRAATGELAAPFAGAGGVLTFPTSTLVVRVA